MWIIIVLIIPAVSIIGKLIFDTAEKNVEERRKRKEQIIAQKKRELLSKALVSVGFTRFKFDTYFNEYNDYISVENRAKLDNYDVYQYFQDNRQAFKVIKDHFAIQKEMFNLFPIILKNESFIADSQYIYLSDTLKRAQGRGLSYAVKVQYITSAGNCLGVKKINITPGKLDEIERNPELYMTKTEIREKEKEMVEAKKKEMYSKVNSIIRDANNTISNLNVRKKKALLEDLTAKLYDRTVNSIQKVKSLESEEWSMIGSAIDTISKDIYAVINLNNKLNNYYDSEEFKNIQNTCRSLMESQKEFNEYIDEKAQSISKLFGTRIVRNETEHEDVYNYVRAYKKTLNPFTAELSSAVFSSAENNPLQYIVKYFYPNKYEYNKQIDNLRILLSELETLKDAKVIIDNYKKDYAEYIQNVPSFVLENDEDGFYSRLGFAIIDENVLNVEYKFVYTSDGGMAQRSFTVPMNEETIASLINQLESKLSIEEQSKEQRALMTTKLRKKIKERDNFSCCNCHNSTSVEPNLLLEIDHIIPVSRGGLTIESNLQTLCWKCNRSKGNKLL